MLDPDHGYLVESTTVDGHFALTVLPPPSPWYQPYLPVMPGVIVALFGLWAAHYFAAQRDKRKEIGDSCERAKAAAEGAAASASAAWLTTGSDAATKNIEAKAKLQTLGNKATNLARLSTRKGFLWHRVLLAQRCEINVLAEVSAFRQLVTADPFEDTSRLIDTLKAAEIGAAASELQSEIDLQYSQLFKLRRRKKATPRRSRSPSRQPAAEDLKSGPGDQG